MFFKTIFKIIFKEKLISFFILIQFILTFFVSFAAIENYKVLNAQKEKANQFFNIKNTLVIYEDGDRTEGLKYIEDYYSILDNLKTIKGIEAVGYYCVSGNQNYEPNFTSSIKQCIYLNEDMLDIITLKDSDGNRINGDVIKKKSTNDSRNPAIVGSALKVKGENFDVFYDGEKIECTAVCSLGEKSFFPGTQHIGAAAVDLKDAVICNVVKDRFKYAAFKGFIKVNGNNAEDLKNSIYKCFKEKGIEVRVVTMEEEVVEYIKQTEGFTIMTYRLAIGLSIFSILGTVITLILSINRKKKEFGIRMATGSSKLYLIGLVYGQIVVIVIAAYIIAFFWEQSRSSENLVRTLGLSTAELFNLSFSIKYLLLVFIIILVFSSMVIKGILRLEPGELVRGKN